MLWLREQLRIYLAGIFFTEPTGFEPVECRHQKPMPYRLAMAQFKMLQTGIEPVRLSYRKILSLLRFPFSPL